MKVGTALNILAVEGRTDPAIVREHLQIGDLAEPLGFDSLWALEHHFTGYSMSPDPTQLLTYFAGRTSRIQLGTAVIVLPWHDPVRVAEEIALLDVLCGGRCLFGFGRGAASVEYAGFRIPMEEARPRFLEAAQVIVKALSQETFEHDGQFFKIPRMSIRPRPFSHPEQRFYASAVSPESAEMMAKLGFGVLVIVQKDGPQTRADVELHRNVSLASGFTPRPPIVLTNVAVSESREEAIELGQEFLGKRWDSVDAHYHFSDGHLANVQGYERYGAMAKTYSKIQDPGSRARLLDYYMKLQVIGTPADCLEQIAEIQRLLGMGHLVMEFGYGGMPHERAELNMRLFADKILPVLQHDPAFSLALAEAQAWGTPQAAAAEASGERLFLPA